MKYHERPARGELTPYVRKIWYLEAPRPAPREKILPMPYVHFIVNLADPYRLLNDDGECVQEFDAGFVSGIQPRYLVIEDPELLRHVGIEFEPYGLGPFTNTPPTALTTSVRASEEILAGSRALRDALHGCDPDTACDRLEEFLCALPRRSAAHDDRVAAACRLIAADPDVEIPRIAAATGATHRGLIELFRRECGITPKAYADVVRFHRFLAELPLDGPLPTWTDLVAHSSYYDQSHFIHTFRRFTGFTPSRYLELVAELGRDYAHFVPLAERA